MRNLRREGRTSWLVGARIRVENLEDLYGYTLNVSHSGLCVMGNGSLWEGTEVLVRIATYPDIQPIQVGGRITWNREHQGAKLAGIMLDSSQEVSKWKTWVAEIGALVRFRSGIVGV